MLNVQISRQGIGNGVAWEGIRSAPFIHLAEREVVAHYSSFETLQSRVLDLIKAVGVKYRYEGVMVSKYDELWQTSQKQPALGDSPQHSQHLQLYDCIPRLRVRKKARTCLDKDPCLTNQLL